MPLAFAILVAVLVQPVRRRAAARLPDRWKWLGVAAAMALVLAVLLLLVGTGWLTVVLFSVVLWGWIWGMAGAPLAVPLTVLIITTCMHVPGLRPAAILLSRDADREQLEAQSTADPSGRT